MTAPAGLTGVTIRSRLRSVETVLFALAAGVLGITVIASVSRPLFYWDSWAYHLPFSALIWNIGSARQTFIPATEIAQLYSGFPLLAEFLQGALWKLTGSIDSIALINSLAFVAFIVVAKLKMSISLPLLTFGSLSVPLIALNATSTYIDLFVAAAICFQVLAATTLEAEAQMDRASSKRHSFSLWIGAYAIAAAIAGNSKFMALVVSLAISAFLVFYMVLRRRLYFPSRMNTVLVATLAATVLSLGTTIRNTHEHHNPFYPIALDIPFTGIHLAGPHKEYKNYPDYTTGLGVLAKPVNWVLSISEIDWRIRGVKPVYNLDSNTGDLPNRYSAARTGGYWGPVIVGSLLLAVLLVTLAVHRNRSGLRLHAFYLYLFMYVSALSSFMPQSHELRYYLHWPILLMVTICILIQAAQIRTRTRLAIIGAYFAAFVVSERMLDFPLQPYPRDSQQETVNRLGTSSEVMFAKRAGATCLGSEYYPNQLMYSSLFHGGAYVIEQGWPACSTFPPYRK
jgi:hypothetical protein